MVNGWYVVRQRFLFFLLLFESLYLIRLDHIENTCTSSASSATTAIWFIIYRLVSGKFLCHWLLLLLCEDLFGDLLCLLTSFSQRMVVELVASQMAWACFL